MSTPQRHGGGVENKLRLFLTPSLDEDEWLT